MSTNTALAGERYFKSTSRHSRSRLIPPATIWPTLRERSLEHLTDEGAFAELVLAYWGIQIEQPIRRLEIGESVYSLAFKSGVRLPFPGLCGILPFDQLDMIIETSLEIQDADRRKCERCKRTLPVIFKHTHITEGGYPNGRWLNEHYIGCHPCLKLRYVHEPVTVDANSI